MNKLRTTSIPITGSLDLHTFRPEEVKDLVTEYLATCQDRGILQIRIVHGKGIGTLRTIVHAVLARNPMVESFQHADGSGGGWGATIVHLKSK